MSVIEETKLFVRQSTGLVREASFFDALIFNLACASCLGVGLSTGLYWAFSVYQRTNILLAIVLATLIVVGIFVTYGLLSAAIPRAGGDYTWTSRLVHPVVGWVQTFCVYWSNSFAAAWWATAFTTVGLVPVFLVWGSLTGSGALTGFSETLQTPWLMLLLGALYIVVVSVIAASGTKRSLRVQNVSYIISLAGLLLALVVLATTTQTEFAAAFDKFAQPHTGMADSYEYIVTTAREQGLVSAAEQGYNGTETFKSIYIVILLVMWSFGSAYLSGEMKGAQSSARQVWSMLGALLIEFVLIFAATWLFFRSTGYEFFASLNYLYSAVPDTYPLAAPPWYILLASIAAQSPLISALIVFTFLGNMFPGIFILVAINERLMFSWAFDRLMPMGLADVNERTHTPIKAIALNAAIWIVLLAWATYSVSFYTVWSLVGLLGFLYIFLAGLAGALFPFTAPEMFKNSPANIKVLGVPLITIAGVECMLACVFATYLLLSSPELITAPNVTLVVLTTAGVVVLAVAIYFGLKFVRARQGFNLDLVYKEIPPE